jgi:hypothetical protein
VVIVAAREANGAQCEVKCNIFDELSTVGTAQRFLLLLRLL